MYTPLKNKVAFVTGSARRVGKAIALAFAREGAHVVIHHGQSPEDAEATAAEIRALGVEALIVRADLAQHDQVEPAFATAIAHFGRLDVLVNSASSFEKADFLDITPDELDRALDINLRAPFWTTQLAGRAMREGAIGGSIINILDNSARQAWIRRAHHGVSKAGLLALTEISALALAPYQIRVNALVMGPILASPGMAETAIGTIGDKVPLKRWGDPDDAARGAIFLATNDYLTGAVISIDGGEFVGQPATLD